MRALSRILISKCTILSRKRWYESFMIDKDRLNNQLRIRSLFSMRLWLYEKCGLWQLMTSPVCSQSDVRNLRPSIIAQKLPYSSDHVSMDRIILLRSETVPGVAIWHTKHPRCERNPDQDHSGGRRRFWNRLIFPHLETLLCVGGGISSPSPFWMHPVFRILRLRSPGTLFFLWIYL